MNYDAIADIDIFKCQLFSNGDFLEDFSVAILDFSYLLNVNKQYDTMISAMVSKNVYWFNWFLVKVLN